MKQPQDPSQWPNYFQPCLYLIAAENVYSALPQYYDLSYMSFM